MEIINSKTMVLATVQSSRTAPYMLANVRFQATPNPPSTATTGAKQTLPSQPIPKAKVLHDLHSATAPEAAEADVIADIDCALDWRWDHDHVIAHARGAFEKRDAASVELFKGSNPPAVIDGVTGGGEGATSLLGEGIAEGINLCPLKRVLCPVMEREDPVLIASPKPCTDMILSS